jgi:hypothetical protein
MSSALLRKKSKKKNTIKTLDGNAEEMDYQKKLKWLKDHGELTGEEVNNPGEDSSGNDSARHTPVGLLVSNRNCYKYFNSTATLLRPRKKSKLKQLSSITIGYIATIKGNKDLIIWKSMRILLDSGYVATLINQNLVKILKTTKENRTKWTTKAGDFSSHRKCEISFTLPAFHKHRQITWNCYGDESNAKSISYDLIISRDLMHEIGIDICFSTAEVRWDNASIPMQPVDKSTEEFEQELLFAQDPLTTDAERIQNMVES